MLHSKINKSAHSTIGLCIKTKKKPINAKKGDCMGVKNSVMMSSK